MLMQGFKEVEGGQLPSDLPASQGSQQHTLTLKSHSPAGQLRSELPLLHNLGCPIGYRKSSLDQLDGQLQSRPTSAAHHCIALAGMFASLELPCQTTTPIAALQHRSLPSGTDEVG